MIYDLNPKITDLDPSIVFPGISQNITIQGENFGTSGTLQTSIPGASIQVRSEPNSWTPNEIRATIAVPTGVAGSYGITVNVGQGNTGQGFVINPAGGPSSPSNSFPVFVNCPGSDLFQLMPSSLEFLDSVPLHWDPVEASLIGLITPIWTGSTTVPYANRIAYVRNTTMRVRARYPVLPASCSQSGFEVEADIKAPDGALLGTLRTPPEVTYPFSPLAPVDVELTLDRPLPDRVDYFDPLRIEWRHIVNGQRRGDGISQHRLHLFLAPRLPNTNARPTTIYETVAWLATASPASQVTTVPQTIEHVWRKFSLPGDTGPADVKNVFGVPLNYYPSGASFTACETSAQGLLWRLDGQCGSFAHLFMLALAAHGIPSEFIPILSVNLQNQPGAQLPTYSVNENTARTHFLVRDWTLASGLSETPPLSFSYRFVAPSPGPDMAPEPPSLVYGVLKKESTLPGQGPKSRPPSQSVFWAHFVVATGSSNPWAPWLSFPLSDGNWMYFDPSYGVKYFGTRDFENKALEGIGRSLDSRTLDVWRFRTDVGGKTPSGWVCFSRPLLYPTYRCNQ